MRRWECLALVMAHENGDEAVLPSHVQEDRHQSMGKVLEGKERWNAEGVLSRGELGTEHEHCKGDGSAHMERLL